MYDLYVSCTHILQPYLPEKLCYLFFFFLQDINELSADQVCNLTPIIHCYDVFIMT